MTHTGAEGRAPNKVPHTPETVRSAAIVFNGDMYTGANHALAIMELEKAHPTWNLAREKLIEEGFLTSEGRFVDRKEAATIAEQAGQTNDSDIDSRLRSDELDSSELLH